MVESARATVAATIGAEAEEFVFTGSATEANHQVLRTLAELYRPGKSKIVSTPIEHPSVMECLDYLAERGIDVEYVPVDPHGRAAPEDFAKRIDSETFAVCCMLANNEPGTIQDVKAVARIARERGVHVLSDCVQALGKMAVDVAELGVDYATFSAHKLHGPKGVGALFVRGSCPLEPFLLGGHQESGFRAGTEGVHNIAGFAEACLVLPDQLRLMGGVAERKKLLLAALRAAKPDLLVNSPDQGCLANTLNVAFPGMNSAVLMAVLDLHGIAVSAGSACSSTDNKPSHVLTAIGLSEDRASESIRMSLGASSSAEDIDHVAKVLRTHLQGGGEEIAFVRAAQVDEAFLFDDRNYILDIRFWHERKMLESLPNSHEASFVSFKRYAHHLRRDKHILVVCMGGVDATVLADNLKKAGYDVSIMLGGVVAWRLNQPDLYKKLAGKNVSKLTPRG